MHRNLHRITSLLILTAAALMLGGCALFGDPLKMGAGEGEARFVQHALKTTTAPDGTVTEEPVPADGTWFSSDMLTDTWWYDETQAYRAPEQTIAGVMTQFLVSRGAASGPYTELELVTMNNFGAALVAGMSQQNLASRTVSANRVSDSQNAAAVANARSKGTQDVAFRALDTVDAAVNPAALFTQAGKAALAAYQAKQAATPATPATPADTATEPAAPAGSN